MNVTRSITELTCAGEAIANTEKAIVVNEITGETEDFIASSLLKELIDVDGVLTERGKQFFDIDEYEPACEVSGLSTLDLVPPGTFRGGSQLVVDETLGGRQVVDEKIERHEISFLSNVLAEIFDGRNDLAEVDTEYLLSRESGMAQTLRSLFINKPGHNGGVSSLRHIFKGDTRGKRSGGLHVPAFAEELSGLTDRDVDPFVPFDAQISIGGVSKLRLVNDGTPRLEPAKTSMYPIGFDSMTVLQCIIDAWEHKGDWDYMHLSRRGNSSNIYEVPVNVDGVEKPLTVRLVTDNETREEKIRTAFPVVS